MKIHVFQFFSFLVLMTQQSFGQDGSFDHTFGVEGKTTFSVSEYNSRGHEVISLPDGSIITIGTSQTSSGFYYSGHISKHLPNGELDPNFGNNGVLFFPYGENGHSRISSSVLQPDGKLLFAAEINGAKIIMRLNQDGSYDSSFGNDGIINVFFDDDIALAPDGKIVAKGQYFDGYNNYYTFSKYNSDGSPDISFGTNGFLIIDVTPYRFDLCWDMKVQSDGKIVAVGTSYNQATTPRAVIVRLESNGERDMTFGSNGVQITLIGESPGNGDFKDVEFQEDGKIVVGGNNTYANGTGGFGGNAPAIVRYNNDGTLDNSFGSNGIVIMYTIYGANDSLRAIALQPDGKILFSGGSSYPFPHMYTEINCTRLNSNGTVDVDFGILGTVLTTLLSSSTNVANSITLQDDKKILAVGISRNPATSYFEVVMLRLNNDSIMTAEDFEYNNIAIFPNPATEHVIVTGLSGSSQFQLYNSLGQDIQISTEAINTTETKINFPHLSSGTYFLKLKNGNKSFTKKLIIN